MEIQNFLVSSACDMKAGLLIADNIQGAKRQLMHKWFTCCDIYLKKHLEKRKMSGVIERVTDVSYYEYNDKIPNWFLGKQGTSFPGLNLRIKAFNFSDFGLDDTHELWFRFEVEENLYGGICIIQKMDDEYKELVDIKQSVLNRIAQKYSNIDISNQSGWWIDWDYIYGIDQKGNQTEECIAFKDMNDVTCLLCDAEILEKTLEQATNLIERFLHNLNLVKNDVKEISD